MGANIFALTNTSETAADLAARCGGKAELVQLLRAAEGTVCCKCHQWKATSIAVLLMFRLSVTPKFLGAVASWRQFAVSGFSTDFLSFMNAFLPKPGQHKLRSIKIERKPAVKTEAWARKQAHWLPRVASFFENATFSPTRHLSSQTSAIRYHCCLQLTRLSRNFKRSSSTRQVWQCWEDIAQSR